MTGMTITSAVELIILAAVLSVVGGAFAGLWLAGRSLGAGLAAMMGAFFGPVAALPATILGLALLFLTH